MKRKRHHPPIPQAGDSGGIRVTNVSKTFGEAVVIDNVSLKIQRGEFVSLTGKSGSGKSTLLYLISSLDKPSAGTVHIDEEDIDAMNVRRVHEFRNRHMGFVFQFHYLLPEFTALENVLMPLRKRGLKPEDTDRAASLLQKFDLADRMHYRPGQLSGGQQQRVAIARALVTEPDYVFADEPTGALDSANSELVMDIFSSIHEGGRTIVYVTHDEEFASRASRQIRLVDGRIA